MRVKCASYSDKLQNIEKACDIPVEVIDLLHPNTP